MTTAYFFSVVATGFVVAFAHAAIPTHWLPFVLAGRAQRWSGTRTLLVVTLCGAGHVAFTIALGALVVWLGIETSKWTGEVFPWIAGGALVLFGSYYLARQARLGHGHHHSHAHGGHHYGGHRHADQGRAAGLTDVKDAESEKKSDAAVIAGLFTLLAFSPCEGFLPVYVSGLALGWAGFLALSVVLAAATLVGMVAFTWLTIAGARRLRLGFLERYENGIIGVAMLLLGGAVMLFGA